MIITNNENPIIFSCDNCIPNDTSNCLCSYKKLITPLINNIIHSKRKKFVYEPTLFGNNSEEYIEKLKIAFEIRQLQMKEGKIAQILIGNFYGWEDLDKGHLTGLDCKKTDNSIIMEVKNKHNTVNSGGEKTVCDKLANYKKKNPNTKCVWGIINSKPDTKKLTKKINHDDVEIERIEGRDLFKLIFNRNEHDYSQEVIDYVKSIIHN